MRPYYFIVFILSSVLTAIDDTFNSIKEVTDHSSEKLSNQLLDPVRSIIDSLSNITINIKDKDYWINSVKGYSEDANLKFTDLTNKYGYPSETHTVTTEDGYILTLFRIVKGKHCKGPLKETLVLIMHGLFDSSDSFIIAGPKNALGYMLSDACYDVWLLNGRGNRYSKKHTCYTADINSEKYWNFTYNEHGIYDLKSGVDYVLNATQSKQLQYIGHSEGTTNFFVLASTNLEYNKKFASATMLAPIAWVYNAKSPLLKLVASKRVAIKDLLDSLSIRELLSDKDDFIVELLSNLIPSDVICILVVIGTGGDPEEIESETIRAMAGHFPNAASTKDLVHLGQGVATDTFRKYDYGTERNMLVYGQANPPDYDISKITAPVALFASKGDRYSVIKDVAKLRNGLPNVVYYNELDEDWGHGHYLFAKTVRTKIVPNLITILDKYQNSDGI